MLDVAEAFIIGKLIERASFTYDITDKQGIILPVTHAGRKIIIASFLISVAHNTKYWYIKNDYQ